MTPPTPLEAEMLELIDRLLRGIHGQPVIILNETLVEAMEDVQRLHRRLEGRR